MSSSPRSSSPDDLNDSKKSRKAYTITRPRESWTNDEHDMFVEGLQLYERDWKRIADFIKTKSVIQIRSHAQKYFMKMSKAGMKDAIPKPRLQKKGEGTKRKREPKDRSGGQQNSSSESDSDSDSASSHSRSRSPSASSNSSLSRASRSNSESKSRSRSRSESESNDSESDASRERKKKKRKSLKSEKLTTKRTPTTAEPKLQAAMVMETSSANKQSALPRSMPSPLSGVKSKSKKVGLYPVNRLPVSADQSIDNSGVSLLGSSASKLFKRDAAGRLKHEGIEVNQSSNISESGQPANWPPHFPSNSSLNWNLLDTQSNGEPEAIASLPMLHNHTSWPATGGPLRSTANPSAMPNYASLNQLSPLSQLSQATDVVDGELPIALPPNALHDANSVNGNESGNEFSFSGIRNSARRSRHSGSGGGNRIKSMILNEIPLSRHSSANSILSLNQNASANPIPMIPRGPPSIGDRDRLHSGSPIVPHSSSSQTAAEGDSKDKAGGDKPEFSKVYAFLGSLFDPSRMTHAEKEFDKLTPMNRDILQSLMQNLATNLKGKNGDGNSSHGSDAASEIHQPTAGVGIFNSNQYSSGRISGNNSVNSPVSSRKSIGAIDPPVLSSETMSASHFPHRYSSALASGSGGLFSSLLGSTSAHHSPIPINTSSSYSGLFSSSLSAPRSPTGSVRDLPFSMMNHTPAVERTLATPSSGMAGIYSPYIPDFLTPQSGGGNSILSGSRLASALHSNPLPPMPNLSNFSPALNSMPNNNNPPSLPPI